MIDFLKRYSPTFGFLALFVGSMVLYLAYYGKELLYTQTYYHLSGLLKPTFDAWLLLMAVAFFANLMLFVLMPGAKFGALGMLRRRSRLRMVVGTSGLVISLAVGIIIITGQVYKLPWLVSILGKMPYFISLILIGGVGLVALFFAIRPTQSALARQWLNLKGRIAALVFAVLTAAILLTTIEVRLKQPPIEQVLSESSSFRGNPTHSISVIPDNRPAKLKPGDSVPFEVLFRLTRFDPNESAKRYPITLDESHSYAASANIRAVGIEISKLPPELAQPRRVKVGEPLSWNWIISAKSNREGTIQFIAVDVFLHDVTEGTIAFNNPLTTIEIKVGTPLGLPTWLISPQVGIGAILGGLLSIVLPWVLTEISARKKSAVDPPKIVTQ